MSLIQVLKYKLSKKLGIPEKSITIPFLKKYMMTHHKELKHLDNYSHIGGNISAAYLKHIPADEEYLNKTYDEEVVFISSLG